MGLRIEREEDQATFSGVFCSKGLGKQKDPIRGTEKKPALTKKENKRMCCSGSQMKTECCQPGESNSCVRYCLSSSKMRTENRSLD